MNIEERLGMSFEDFEKAFASAMKFSVEYYKNLPNLPLDEEYKSGDVARSLPSQPPTLPSNWEEVQQDLKTIILKGITNVQSGLHFLHFPYLTSFPSILAEMTIQTISTNASSNVVSPAAIELERVAMNWLGQALGLPERFMSKKKGDGIGVILRNVSEANLISIVAARAKMLSKLKSEGDKAITANKLVAYTSELANFSVLKAGFIAMCNLRKLNTDSQGRLKGAILEQAIEQDLANGNVPFYVCATSGTTSICSFDDLEEIGLICKQRGVWLHVDAAYGGGAAICPEFRHHIDGVEFADSFSISGYKILMVSPNCAPTWFANSKSVSSALNFTASYASETEVEQEDYYFQVALTKPFSSLKLWMVLRMYGIDGLQRKLREDVRIAQRLEELVESDPLFEMSFPRNLAVVCFTVKAFTDADIGELIHRVNLRGVIRISSVVVNGKRFVRLAIGSVGCCVDLVEKAWKVIKREVEGFQQERD